MEREFIPIFYTGLFRDGSRPWQAAEWYPATGSIMCDDDCRKLLRSGITAARDRTMGTIQLKDLIQTQPEEKDMPKKATTKPKSEKPAAFHTCRVCGDTIVTTNSLTCEHPECLKVGEIIDQVQNKGINDAALESDFRKIADWYTIRLCAFAYDRFPNMQREIENRLFDVGYGVCKKMPGFLDELGGVSVKSSCAYDCEEVMARRKQPAPATEPAATEPVPSAAATEPAAEPAKCVVCGDPIQKDNNGSRVCFHPDCMHVEKLVAIALAGEAERLKSRLKEAGPVVQMMVYYAGDRFFPYKKFDFKTKECKSNKLIGKTLNEIRGNFWTTEDPLCLVEEKDIQDYRKEFSKNAKNAGTASIPSAPVACNRLQPCHWLGHFGQGGTHHARNLTKLFSSGFSEAFTVDVAGKKATVYFRDGGDGDAWSDTRTYPTKAAAEREQQRLHNENIPDLSALHRLAPLPHLVRTREHHPINGGSGKNPTQIWHRDHADWCLMHRMDGSREDNIAIVSALMADPNILEDGPGLDDLLELYSSEPAPEANPEPEPSQPDVRPIVIRPPRRPEAKLHAPALPGMDEHVLVQYAYIVHGDDSGAGDMKIGKASDARQMALQAAGLDTVAHVRVKDLFRQAPPWKTFMIFDGDDVSVVSVAAVDAFGRRLYRSGNVPQVLEYATMGVGQ